MARVRGRHRNHFLLYPQEISCFLEKPNLKYINNLSGGDSDFQAKLMEVIKEEFPNERIEFENNIFNSNYLQAAKNVHKLKHKFSILGLEQSYNLANEFEEGLKQSKLDGLLHFTKVLDRISAFLEQV